MFIVDISEGVPTLKLLDEDSGRASHNCFWGANPFKSRASDIGTFWDLAPSPIAGGGRSHNRFTKLKELVSINHGLILVFRFVPRLKRMAGRRMRFPVPIFGSP